MKGASDCLHDVTMYLYYALCFLLVEHSVCNEPISVLINIYIYIYINQTCTKIYNATYSSIHI